MLALGPIGDKPTRRRDLCNNAALYNYPYEHHGPATRETLLDLWARWVDWLEIHVKNHGRVEEEIDPEPVAGTSGKNR